MKERGKVLSPTLFLEAIEGAKKDLELQCEFLKQAIQNPKLLFQQADSNLGLKSIIFHIMNGFLFHDDKLLAHDFQVLLANVINRFVQEWASQKGIHEKITVRVRNEKKYPSIFAIYVEDMELIQFSLYEKFYGIRNKVFDENAIQLEYEYREEQVNKNVELMLTMVQKYEKVLAHPHQYVRDYYQNKWMNNDKLNMAWKLPFLELREHFSLLLKKENVMIRVQEKLESTQARIESERKSLLRYPAIQDCIQKNHLREELTRKLMPLFEECGYRMETEQYRLY
ncbi:hypothetical protein [Paenibacillus polymyxa]|uniref:Uncharacterized protein n=1 Tax=Paenibacillus polymyxa (strain SC2) TaxID=886882 RepID=E3EJY0_PAEPS|nr:hypothetical protein [Paenibacillus polymyxa]ADO59999.1 hypothetical protein PPSC2_28185 [Paenibacillus polymyxa SC2]WPQ59783.1 hypothetical protein SKN87_26200 [Paenibacillus polymyxa]